MATTTKNSAAWLLLLLLLFKKKKTSSVIVENPLPTHNVDADFSVQVRRGAKLYGLNKTTQLGVVSNTSNVDGFKTNELPTWVKVRIGNTFYYVTVGDFKIN